MKDSNKYDGSDRRSRGITASEQSIKDGTFVMGKNMTFGVNKIDDADGKSYYAKPVDGES
jgi:hypothetical protein